MDLDLHSLSSDSDGEGDGNDGNDAGSTAAGQSIQTGATAGELTLIITSNSTCSLLWLVMMLCLSSERCLILTRNTFLLYITDALVT